MNTETTINAAVLTSDEPVAIEEVMTETATVADHGIGFTPEGLEWSLPIMGKGMLGIFIVTTIIVTVTVVLNKVTAPRKPKEKKDKNSK